MIKWITHTGILILLGVLAGPAYSSTLLIRGAKVYTMTSKGILQKADILIKNNIIQAVGHDIRIQADHEIDAQGKVVTPGLMAANTQIGLYEIAAIEETVDSDAEDMAFGASFNIEPVFNSRSTLIPENRRGGVTRTLIRPRSRHHLFSGRAAIMSLNGKPSATLVRDVATYARFGEAGAEISGGSRASALMRLESAFADVRVFMANRAAVERGEWREFSLSLADLEALIPIVRGQRPLVVSAHRASDLLVLIKFAQQEKIYLVIDGGAEAWMVAEQLAQANVPVIMDPMENIPGSFERIGSRLDAAAILHKAGVHLIFTGPNSHNAYLMRQSAGNAVAYGLPHEAALEAMITNPATVFGGAKNYGQIKKGYLAEIVVWDGDPLEVTTNAEHVIIDGEAHSLVSRSSRLRDRYWNLNKNPAYIR